MIASVTGVSAVVSRRRRSLQRSFLSNRLYSLAITRQVSPSITDALSKSPAVGATVHYETCVQQHKQYVSCLRSILPTLSLPTLADHPDCVFVEDTVVAVGNKALLTRPGHSSRRGEVESIRLVLQQLGMETHDADQQRHGDDDGGNDDNNVRIDGGDVLYTGRHMFVGLSERTNYRGFERLQSVFGRTNDESATSSPSVAVIPIELPAGTNALHLKSMTTHLDPSTLLVVEGEEGDGVLRSLEQHHSSYRFIRLPNMLACNVVSVRNHVLAQDTNCTVSRERITTACQERNLQLHWIDTSEFEKVDGALTCCSVLLDL